MISKQNSLFLILVTISFFTLSWYCNPQQNLLYKDIVAQYEQEKSELETYFCTHFYMPECLQCYITQPLTINLDHLFLPTLRYAGQQGMKISGFHHDYQNQISQCEAFYIEKIKELSTGFYAGYVSGTGYTQHIPPTQKWYKTFFPASWTRKHLIEILCKVLSRAKIDQKRSTSKQIVIKGFYSKNTAIVAVFDIQKQTFVAIYPLLYSQS